MSKHVKFNPHSAGNIIEPGTWIYQEECGMPSNNLVLLTAAVDLGHLRYWDGEDESTECMYEGCTNTDATFMVFNAECGIHYWFCKHTTYGDLERWFNMNEDDANNEYPVKPMRFMYGSSTPLHRINEWRKEFPGTLPIESAKTALDAIDAGISRNWDYCPKHLKEV